MKINLSNTLTQVPCPKPLCHDSQSHLSDDHRGPVMIHCSVWLCEKPGCARAMLCVATATRLCIGVKKAYMYIALCVYMYHEKGLQNLGVFPLSHISLQSHVESCRYEVQKCRICGVLRSLYLQ